MYELEGLILDLNSHLTDQKEFKTCTQNATDLISSTVFDWDAGTRYFFHYISIFLCFFTCNDVWIHCIQLSIQSFHMVTVWPIKSEFFHVKLLTTYMYVCCGLTKVI